MKLSPNTVTILKNFSSINTGIYINAGNVLTTVAPAKDILAEATVEDTFPVPFGIYDLNEFLSVLSLHKEAPEVEFDEHHVVIKGLTGRSKIKYRFTDKQMIVTPPDKKIKFPTPEVEFEMKNDDFKWITTAASVLKLPNIAIKSDGTEVSFVTSDAKDDSRSTDSLDIDIPGNGVSYNMFYKAENFGKLYPGDYDVKFAKNGISSYRNKAFDLHYYVMFEAKSEYNT